MNALKGCAALAPIDRAWRAAGHEQLSARNPAPLTLSNRPDYVVDWSIESDA
jgi:hypothetical protein